MCEELELDSPSGWWLGGSTPSRYKQVLPGDRGLKQGHQRRPHRNKLPPQEEEGYRLDQNAGPQPWLCGAAGRAEQSSAQTH